MRPSTDQRRADADAGLLAELERRPRVRLGRLPRPAQEPEAGARAEQVLDVAVEPALDREAHRAVDVRGDAHIGAAHHQRRHRDVDEGAGGVVVVAGAGGEGERLVEHRAAALVRPAP